MKPTEPRKVRCQACDLVKDAEECFRVNRRRIGLPPSYSWSAVWMCASCRKTERSKWKYASKKR